jgi:hypothetical protein
MALSLSEREALAQGITGSAVTGTVYAEGVGPLQGTIIRLRNTATGETFTAVTGSSGEYFLDNVPPGGPYTITATAVGYDVTTQEGIRITLGQRLSVDLAMHLFGEEVVVVGHELTVLDDRDRTGASITVKDTKIAMLPLAGRNFTDLIATAPGATREATGVSIAGQNNRFNNIQIDGGANNDLFGLSPNGTPGGQARAKPLSVEAIQEFVVQVSPFDVRYGNFAGGLVNAITKSGTNEFHGSLFGYYQGRSLSNTKYYNSAGQYVEDPAYLDYKSWQFGASVGGPIIKDKLHFFIATDFQERSSSFGNAFQIGGVNPDEDKAKAGFTTADAQRFTDILANRWNIHNVGNALAPTLKTPDRNVFAKLTTSVIPNSHLEVSYNFVHASDDVLIRNPTAPSLPTSPTSAGNLRDGYEMSNSGYAQVNTTNTVRLKLTSSWADGKISNELLGGASFIRDSREVPNRIPLILVKICAQPPAVGCGGNLGNQDSWLAAGAERFSQANTLDQNIFQIQDNLTLSVDKHRVTFGTSNEFLRIRNVFFQASYGVWAFNSLEDLDAGRAAAFQRRLAVSDVQEPGTAAFKVTQLGFYVQDEWSLQRNFVVTPGVRVDVPILSMANTNPTLKDNPAFPIDTSQVPTNNPLWSPRLGFNWDVEGNASTIVRGGAGIFSGRPPYVWVSNAYSINGLSQVELTCINPTPGVPPFNPDPDNQPSTCSGGPFTPPTNQGEIDYFAPNTKYPQNLRLALGVDKRLPWEIIGSLDLMYTADVNGWYTTDENLVYQGTDGEGRALYGTPTATGTATPVRVDSTHLQQAIKVFNKNGGRTYSAAISLSKEIARIIDVTVSYMYSRSEDRISLTSSQALSNFRFSPIDGTIQDRNVRPSNFDRPHKISVSGVARLPLGLGVGLTYVGQSGLPYTWVVQGDVNGDGINGNDLVFVPADQSQITLQNPSQWDALNRFIQSQDCLKDARGSFVQRGACRNPWVSFVDLRLSWASPEFIKGHHVEVQFDIFNLLNLIDRKLGHFDQATQFETHNSTFLRAVGYDAVNKRPVYTFTEPTNVVNTVYSPTQSRWRMQLGAKYVF